jgi:hypothetical protein
MGTSRVPVAAGVLQPCKERPKSKLSRLWRGCRMQLRGAGCAGLAEGSGGDQSESGEVEPAITEEIGVGRRTVDRARGGPHDPPEDDRPTIDKPPLSRSKTCPEQREA